MDQKGEPGNEPTGTENPSAPREEPTLGYVTPIGTEVRAVDGETVHTANTDDMVFGAVATIAYVSTILTLNPGDVLALGTPGGVGHARKPPRYLTPGAVLTTTIAGLGELRNTCVPEKQP